MSENTDKNPVPMETVEKLELEMLLYKTRALKAEKLNLITKFLEEDYEAINLTLNLAEAEKRKMDFAKGLYKKYGISVDDYIIDVDLGVFKEKPKDQKEITKL